MSRTLPLLSAALLACVAVPAFAQGTIRPGQTVRGELSDNDSVAGDGSFYDVWRFRAQAGHVYAVTLRSEEFDAYLGVGSSAGADCEDCRSNDDFDGTDSQVLFRAESSGMLEIRANSLSEGETGAYSLELEDRGENAEFDEDEEAWTDVDVEEGAVEEIDVDAMVASMSTPIRLGGSAEGELTEDDLVADDGSFFDIYSYRGRAGETVTITLRSDDFDTFLTVSYVNEGELEEVGVDDDGDGGTNSRLTVTLPGDGVYLIQANSLSGGETGAYVLSITRG